MQPTRIMISSLVLGAASLLAPIWAQAPAGQVDRLDTMPIYRVTVVARTAKALNYQHRSGATKIDFRGTPLLPKARGEAKVESKQGYIEIEVEFDDLQVANNFGPEYLTYVLWAITPEGRAKNLGEVILNGTKSKLDVTTDMQVFGLVVTAEPYFAVTQPSDVVVMENMVRADTKGKVEEIEAKYELLQRGQYTMNVAPADRTKLVLDPKRPQEVLQARNAVQIAAWTGADKYAGETYRKAVDLLDQAENYQLRKTPATKPAAMIAREAVQTAEDSRLITIKRIEEERLANERQAAAERESLAKTQADTARAQADAESQRRQLAEQAQVQAQQAAAIAERERTNAEAAQAAAQAASATSRAQAEAESQRRQVAEQAQLQAEQKTLIANRELANAEAAKAAAQAATIAAQAEADKIRHDSELARAAAEAETNRLQQQAALERANVDAARAAAEAQQKLAQSETERARLAADDANRRREQSEQEKIELKDQLRQQLNLVLETRSTARGLIINMSDVLFDTAKFTLRVGAREKLAKISGIIVAHPGLKLEIEGHTDGVGGDDYNQRLSEQRASSVRDYLVQQGISMNSVTARGFGKTQPVASNDAAAGRQQNRRVELVVSGEQIGNASASTTTIVRP